MRGLIISFGVAVLITMPQPLFAQATGEQLLNICKLEDYNNKDKCISFIEGSIGGANYMFEYMFNGVKQNDLAQGFVHPLLQTSDGFFCIPKNVTKGQTSAVVIKYLLDHPELRHGSSSALALAAVKKAWPC